jgi:hypothetical protein
MKFQEKLKGFVSQIKTKTIGIGFEIKNFGKH